MASFFDPLRWFIEDNGAGRELSRLIAVLPDIDNPQEVKSLLKEIIGPVKSELPLFMRALFATGGISPKLLVSTLNFGSKVFAKKFIAGNGEEEILKACNEMRRRGFLSNIDILGEAVLSEKEADCYLRSYLELIPAVAREFSGENLSFSVKLSAFYSQARPTSPEHASEIIMARVSPIAALLQKHGGHVYLDAEEYEFFEIYFATFAKLYKQYGNTIRFVLQSYLKNSKDTLENLIKLNDEKSPIHLRLVRGAYWDHECYRAENLGWEEPPVFTEKRDTDKNFEEIFRASLRNGLIAIPGTHNAGSIYFAAMEERFGAQVKEFQFLKGIGEPLAEIIRKRGYKVRFYMPTLFPKGNLNAAVAYLVRRIVENKSQTSFIANHRGKKLEYALQHLQSIRAREVA